MNSENLKTPSTEEARARGKKGGIASGKARVEKKRLKEAVESILSMKYDSETGKKLTGYEMVALALFNKAKTGDVPAFNSIRDLTGEKPKETLEFESQEITGIKVKFVDKSNRSNRKEKDPKIVGDYTPPTNTEEK